MQASSHAGKQLGERAGRQTGRQAGRKALSHTGRLAGRQGEVSESMVLKHMNPILLM